MYMTKMPTCDQQARQPFSLLSYNVFFVQSFVCLLYHATHHRAAV